VKGAADEAGTPLVSCPDCVGGQMFGHTCAFCEGAGYISSADLPQADLDELKAFVWQYLFGEEPN